MFFHYPVVSGRTFCGNGADGLICVLKWSRFEICCLGWNWKLVLVWDLLFGMELGIDFGLRFAVWDGIGNWFWFWTIIWDSISGCRVFINRTHGQKLFFKTIGCPKNEIWSNYPKIWELWASIQYFETNKIRSNDNDPLTEFLKFLFCRFIC